MTGREKLPTEKTKPTTREKENPDNSLLILGVKPISILGHQSHMRIKAKVLTISYYMSAIVSFYSHMSVAMVY